jgi:UPF0755 protein
MSIKKIILILFLLVLVVGLFIGHSYYNKIYKGNISENGFLFIPSNTTFEEVTKIVTPYLNDYDSFKWVAEQKNYPNKIKAGKYEVTKGMTTNELVNLLRSGNQIPVKVSFNNQDTVEKLAGRIATQIEADSLSILNAITDSNFLKKNNLTRANVLGIFVPNSYEFFWNTSAEKFRNRFLKEFSVFWTTERTVKAKKLNLTKHEVIALASIVQKETAKASERPLVAGLYLNRLRNGWALGADPTIIFAIKQKYGQNTVIKRVLTKDLSIDSPYNTYTNRGIPPSLIAMPDISAIDAVLNDKRHDYYYMCASVTKLGYHAFAKTLAQHNVNARKYHKWVTKQGIMR